jgi:very-short-patch-repair endonuclease
VGVRGVERKRDQVALTWREDPEKAPSEVRRARARTLRREQTEPEKRLWWHLRHRLPTEGTHFRRQVPLGGFIADFCNLSAKLVVEVDGDQHGLDANREHDARRTEFLPSQGFRVLRFSNRDVMTAIDMVLDTIHAALFVPTPTPTPPRKGEGK